MAASSIYALKSKKKKNSYGTFRALQTFRCWWQSVVKKKKHRLIRECHTLSLIDVPIKVFLVEQQPFVFVVFSQKWLFYSGKTAEASFSKSSLHSHHRRFDPQISTDFLNWSSWLDGDKRNYFTILRLSRHTWPRLTRSVLDSALISERLYTGSYTLRQQDRIRSCWQASAVDESWMKLHAECSLAEIVRRFAFFGDWEP